MTPKTVYLAGPIAGQLEASARAWRYDATRLLNDYSDGRVSTIDPLRYTNKPKGPGGTYDNTEDVSTGSIYAKNLYDVRRCDAVLVYFPPADDAVPVYFPPADDVVSLGTLVEIGMAAALGKPIFMVSYDSRPLNHPVVRGAVGWVFNDLIEACEAIEEILP